MLPLTLFLTSGCEPKDACAVAAIERTEDPNDTCTAYGTCHGTEVSVTCVDRGEIVDCSCNGRFQGNIAGFATSAPICFGDLGFTEDVAQELFDACDGDDISFTLNRPTDCAAECCSDTDCASSGVCQNGVCVAPDDCPVGRRVLEGPAAERQGPLIAAVGARLPVPGDRTWTITLGITPASVPLDGAIAQWNEGGDLRVSPLAPSRLAVSGQRTVDVEVPVPTTADRAIQVRFSGGLSNIICIPSLDL